MRLIRGRRLIGGIARRVATTAGPWVLFAARARPRKRTRHVGPGPGRSVRFEAFERRAREQWDQIPEHYRAGVDGLVVERDAHAHPSLADVYTLGECVTEAYPSDFGGPETIRSFVVLYYGSFRRLAHLDAEFAWDHEIWETLTHELQHHLESLAADEGLIDMDYAVDESFKRREGAAFDPRFHQSGESLGGGWYRVDEELYLERAVAADAGSLDFELDGRTWRVDLPEDVGDIAFLDVTEGLPDDAPPLTVVVARRRGFVERARAALARHELRIVQTDVQALPAPDWPGPPH